MSGGGYLQGREHVGDLTLDADVVVIGSGAGGSVLATEPAEAGWRVIVLEEGPRITAEAHGRMRPSESLRHLWRDGALTAAVGLGRSPLINVTMGRGVGGSSLVTGGVSFRTPEAVLDEWVRDHRLDGLSSSALTPVFDHVERRVRVAAVPEDMRSNGTVRFAEGATRMGLTMKSLRRNVQGCVGHGQCNFGCPKQAKLSVDLSYLPSAIAHGATVVSDCRVSRVLRKGARAIGVEGWLLSGPDRRKRGRVRVHAKTVVVAAGAWHTPGVIRRSGLARGSKAVGRNLTLHPSFRMFARFDTPVRGWAGSLQSAWSDHYESERVTLVGLHVPPAILAATMPGFGPEHLRRARDIPNLAVMGGLVHDDNGGTVHRGIGHEPFVTYRMSARDRSAVNAAIRRMGEIFLAAGAEAVYPPILGQAPVDADTFRRMDFDRVPASRLESASQHPLGSARMATDSAQGAVDPDGRVWGLDNLYVADGSVVPTSLGVNPQITVMTLATQIAWGLRDRGLPAA